MPTAEPAAGRRRRRGPPPERRAEDGAQGAGARRDEGPPGGLGRAGGRARRGPRAAAVGLPRGAAVRLQHRRSRPLRPAGGEDVQRRHAEPALLRQPAGVHVPAALPVRDRLRGRRRRRQPLPPRPGRRLRARADRRGGAGDARPVAAVSRRRPAARAGRRAAGRGDRGGRLPAELLLPPGPQRRPHARAPDRLAAGNGGGAAQRPCPRLPAGGRRSRAGVRDQVHGRDRDRAPAGGRRPAPARAGAGLLEARARGRARRRRWRRWRCSCSPTPTRCSTRTPSTPNWCTSRAPSAESQGKLGAPREGGVVYYLWTFTWGLGWVPALAALAGMVLVWRREKALGWVLVPAPLLFLAFMGLQGRYFGRWLLPIFPIACLLAAVTVAMLVGALGGRGRAVRWVAAAVLGAGLLAQGLVHSLHSGARDGARRHPQPDAAVDARAHPPQRADRGRAGLAERLGGRTEGLAGGRPPLEQVPLAGLAHRRPRRAHHAHAQDRDRELRDHAGAVADRLLRGQPLLLGGQRLDPVRPRLRRPAGGAARDRLLPGAGPGRRSRVPRLPLRRRRASRSSSTST